MYDKIKEIIKRDDNRHYFYCLLLKMLYICELLNIRLIIENPYSTEHYLYNNFPYSPTIIDKDRTRRGDYYKKPTQFIFCNCTPTNGISFTKPLIHKNVRSGKPGIKGGICSEDRSLISTDYARNFICDFIIGKEQTNTIPQLKFAD